MPASAARTERFPPTSGPSARPGARPSTGDRAERRALDGGDPAIERVVRPAAEGCHHGAVNGAQTGALPERVEGGDVAEADEEHGAYVFGVELPEQARAAVAAARADDRVDIGVGERGAQLAQPAGVVAGEVAAPRRDVLGVSDAVARAEALEAALEVREGEGRRGRHHAHVRALREGGDRFEARGHVRP